MPPFFQNVAAKSNIFTSIFGHPRTWGTDSPTTTFFRDELPKIMDGTFQEEIEESAHQQRLCRMKHEMRRRVEEEHLKKSIKLEEKRLMDKLELEYQERLLQLPATQENQ